MTRLGVNVPNFGPTATLRRWVRFAEDSGYALAPGPTTAPHRTAGTCVPRRRHGAAAGAGATRRRCARASAHD